MLPDKTRRMLEEYEITSGTVLGGQVMTARETGFAATVISSPVKGEIILRAFLAGLRTALIFRRPGSVNVPAA